MPPRTPAAPQVPGEPIVVQQDEESQAEAVSESTETESADTAEQVEAEPVADNPGDTVMVDRVELSALLAEVRELRAKVEAEPVAAKRANPEAGLPDSDSIDVGSLRSPILTKQGWLVPENFGANPAVKKAL